MANALLVRLIHLAIQTLPLRIFIAQSKTIKGEYYDKRKNESKKDKNGFLYLWICKECHLKKYGTRARYQSSEYKGVKKVNSYFRANIKVNKKTISIGSHKTEIEAAKAFNDYIIEHKLDRKLNIIPEGA